LGGELEIVPVVGDPSEGFPGFGFDGGELWVDGFLFHFKPALLP
jgi:hypothetical protein